MDKLKKTIKKNNRNQSSGIISPGRKAIFSVLLLLFPFLVLILTELSLMTFGYGDSYNLFVDFKYFGKEYKRCNPEYGKKYFYHFKYTSPQNDIFLKEKPRNGLRIFVIGSSSVWGFPYGSGIMFSRILHQRLQDSYPEKHVEVINTAITAINSYTLLDIVDEIIQEKPDAILIYAGHNEFYGAMGVGSKEGLGQIRWLKRLHLNLLEFKTYQLFRNLLLGIPRWLGKKSADNDPATATLMERIVSNTNIEYKSKTYNRAHRQYFQNMDAILRKAKRHNVPVVYSELICNIKDLRPFGSVKTTKYPAASNVFEEAIACEKKGEYAEAKALYYQARDLDCIRFRASSDMNQIIHELCEKNSVCLVPMMTIFESNSPNGLIGNNLLTEHVHPNIDGYFLIADAFYNALVKNIIPEKLDSSHYMPSEYYRQRWGFTEIDSVYADLILRQLKGGWPFKPDTVINTFIYDYKPVTIIDSLAYLAVRFDDISLETAHKKMAAYYTMHNEPEKAFKEYQSMLKINPYNYKEYIEAGDLLIKSRNYDKALEIFLSSLRIHKEVYSLSKIGELYTLKGDMKKALPYLEEVRSIDPEFLKAKNLELLYRIYTEIHDTVKANKMQAELSTLNGKEKKKNQVVLYSSQKVKNYIDQAIKLLQMGKIDEALVILYKANGIQETSTANRIIGEVLLSKNDKSALSFLKKAYFDNSSDPNFLNTLCYASIHLNDFAYAEKILIDLKQLSPGHPNIAKFEKMISQQKEIN